MSTVNKELTSNSEDITVDNHKLVGQIIGLGVVAGMRASFAPAALSQYLSNNPDLLEGTKFAFMASPVTSIITKVMAAGEIVGDKLPATPDRISVPQIFARIASGALTGLVLSKAANKNLLSGFLIGGTSALAGTFGSFYLRKYVDTLPHVKDAFTGAGEDVIALTTGLLLIK